MKLKDFVYLSLLSVISYVAYDLHQNNRQLKAILYEQQDERERKIDLWQYQQDAVWSDDCHNRVLQLNQEIKEAFEINDRLGYNSIFYQSPERIGVMMTKRDSLSRQVVNEYGTCPYY